jgi:DNA-binding NarL/FixJ family response regulator
LARRNVRLLLEKDPQIEVVGECRDGREAVKAIKSLSPDLIFLDIQMPALGWMSLLFAHRSSFAFHRSCPFLHLGISLSIFPYQITICPTSY